MNKTIAFVVKCRSPVAGTSNSVCRKRFIVETKKYFFMKNSFETHSRLDIKRILVNNAARFVAREQNPLKLANILVAADYAEGADFLTCIINVARQISRLGYSLTSSKMVALDNTMKVFEWMPIEYASEYIDMGDINDFLWFLSDNKIEIKDGQVRCGEMLSLKRKLYKNI